VCGPLFVRDIAREGERSHWDFMDPRVPGTASRFGLLAGLHGLDAPRRLEFLPYTSGSLTRSPNADANPFRQASGHCPGFWPAAMSAPAKPPSRGPSTPARVTSRVPKRSTWNWTPTEPRLPGRWYMPLWSGWETGTCLWPTSRRAPASKSKMPASRAASTIERRQASWGSVNSARGESSAMPSTAWDPLTSETSLAIHSSISTGSWAPGGFGASGRSASMASPTANQ
jgi:hypothetical protein